MKLAAPAYLASYFLSILGNSIAAIALPLIVLRTTGSVLGTGSVAAATAIPAILAATLASVAVILIGAIVFGLSSAVLIEVSGLLIAVVTTTGLWAVAAATGTFSTDLRDLGPSLGGRAERPHCKDSDDLAGVRPAPLDPSWAITG